MKRSKRWHGRIRDGADTELENDTTYKAMIFRKCKTGSPGRAGPDARSVQGELPKWSPAGLQSSGRRGGTKGNREGQRDTAATGDTPVQRGEDARSTKERSGKSEIKTPPPRWGRRQIRCHGRYSNITWRCNTRSYWKRKLKGLNQMSSAPVTCAIISSSTYAYTESQEEETKGKTETSLKKQWLKFFQMWWKL